MMKGWSLKGIIIGVIVLLSIEGRTMGVRPREEKEILPPPPVKPPIEIKKEIKQELKGELKQELKGELKQELKAELREETKKVEPKREIKVEPKKEIKRRETEMERIRRELARWKAGEARWRRLATTRWTPAELRRLRQEAIESQPRSPEDEVIVIRRGDTLWDLAHKYFGNPWLWPRLWAYNGNLYIENPHEIKPGRELVIPRKEVIAPKLPVVTKPPIPKEPPVIPTEPPIPKEPPTPKEDKVKIELLRKEIDLLKKIKDEKEEKIAQLNRELIDLKARDIERERLKRELEGRLEDALTDRRIYETTVVAQKEAEIARLQREVEDLKDQLYFLENELAKKEAEIREKEAMIRAQEATIGSQIHQINRLSSSLDEERREMEQFFAFVGIIGGIIALSLSN